MLSKLTQKFSIQPIVDQVNGLSFDKRLDLNIPTGNFFNDPWKTDPQFESTPLGEVLSSIGPIGQARLLKLESAESYTAHCDPDDRIHLAIITNPYSFLVDIEGNTMYHLPADGQLWHMDTSKIHVASNWGPRTRIHLNIRVLLPRYNDKKNGLSIKVVSGNYDWKQLAYTPLMQIINKFIKNNQITGFKKINEQEVLINIDTPDILNPIFKQIEDSGVNLKIVKY